jgi:choline-glycine betaine transporter
MYDPASKPAGAPDAGLGWRLFGVLLVIAGVLLTGFSGLCTAAVLMDPGGGPELGDLTSAAIVVGGPFILVGLLMWWGGVKAFKKGRRAQAALQAAATATAAEKSPEPPAPG